MSPLDELAPYPVLLAPMVGLTHFVVRKALQEYLPTGERSLWPTEMLSSRRIPYQRGGEFIETRFDDADAGLCPQLLGNEEGFIRESILKLKDWGARAIDINMGCPVKKALQHNYGVSLMGDPDYAAEITAYAVKHAGGLPVSVKLRAAPPPKKGAESAENSVGPDPEFLLKFCLKLQDAGASWLTLHPRTAVQKRKGNADWTQIAQLKKSLKIPLIGNGDVQNLADVRAMSEQTGCDRVMIGRALIAKPWILRHAKANAQITPNATEAGAEYGRFLLRVLELMREHYEPSLAVRRFKFLVYHGSPYLEFGHTLRSRLDKVETYEILAARLTEFFGEGFERPQRMLETTEFRA